MKKISTLKKCTYDLFLTRVVYQWKLVVTLEHVNSIQELNVYQVRVVQVVSYYLQAIHVVRQEIHVIYLKFVMERLLRYGNI